MARRTRMEAEDIDTLRFRMNEAFSTGDFATAESLAGRLSIEMDGQRRRAAEMVTEMRLDLPGLKEAWKHERN